MSQSGDCERLTDTNDLPRCPDGFHRSPSGDCERVTFGELDNTNSILEKDSEEESFNETTSINNGLSFPESSEIQLTQTSGCIGGADCFRETVTKIVDGDTIDVNNVPIRLSMINTPER